MPADRREDIIGAVDASISTLTSLFTTEATRFFTENDLVCAFHRLVSDALAGMNMRPITDADGKPHSLIHCEYPTPFRCDMGKHRFVVKSDDELTPGRKKYRRGHFDVVVLDPTFVKKHPYPVVKAQKYDTVRFVLSPTGVFHPKLYLFESTARVWEAVVGSPNLTRGGAGRERRVRCAGVRGQSRRPASIGRHTPSHRRILAQGP